jgi:putative two-component system response regulator
VPKEWRARLEVTGQALLVVAAPWLSYTRVFTAHHLRVVCVLPIVWLAYRWGLRGALPGAATVAVVSVARILFARDHLDATGVEDFLLFQSVVAGLAVSMGSLVDHSRASNEERYRLAAIVRSSSDAIIGFDRGGLVRSWNKAAESVFGYTAAEMLGKNTAQVLAPPERVEEAQEIVDRALRGEALTDEFEVIRRDGAKRQVWFTLSVIRSHGRVIGLSAIVRDITERKAMEARLREREQANRLLFDTNPLPMLVYDRETLQILTVNDAAVSRYGYSREEFLHMRIRDLQVSDPIARVIESITGGSTVDGEFRHRLKNGTVIDVEVSVNRLDYGDRPGALVLVQDITDRKLLQQARRQATKESLDRLGRAAEYRDDETYEHTVRVGRMVRAICRKMGLDEDESTLMSLAAPLHDIGKIGVPDAILLKPTSLTPEEFAIIKDHVYHGRRIIGGGTTQLFQLAEQIALYHHERFDGTGYIGLTGEEIPMGARITSVADVFDALTHKRPYKPAWPIMRALEEIRDGRGTQFDPDVVDAFLQIMRSGGHLNGDHNGDQHH